jgi:hypothetical protein
VGGNKNILEGWGEEGGKVYEIWEGVFLNWEGIIIREE